MPIIFLFLRSRTAITCWEIMRGLIPSAFQQDIVDFSLYFFVWSYKMISRLRTNNENRMFKNEKSLTFKYLWRKLFVFCLFCECIICDSGSWCEEGFVLLWWLSRWAIVVQKVWFCNQLLFSLVTLGTKQTSVW